MLSGGPGLNPYYLEPLYSELKKKYECILLHQRGTGESLLDEVNQESLTVQKYIDDLNGLYKKLGKEKLVLVGHSWGGMLSFSYAANEPNKVKKVILLNTGGVTDAFYTWFGSNINMRLQQDDADLYQEQIDNKRSTLVAIWPGYFFDREIALKTRPPLDYKFQNQSGINPLASGDWRKRSADRVNKLKNYKGPIDLIDLKLEQTKARSRGEILSVNSVDKFPKMADFVVPKGIRIGDASRVRLGAHLGNGTTVTVSYTHLTLPTNREV